MGVQRHNVPHFKGLIMLYLDFEAQGRGSTFTLCHSYLKKAILLHKMARLRFDLNAAVLGLQSISMHIFCTTNGLGCKNQKS